MNLNMNNQITIGMHVKYSLRTIMVHNFQFSHRWKRLYEDNQTEANARHHYHDNSNKMPILRYECSQCSGQRFLSVWAKGEIGQMLNIIIVKLLSAYEI